MVWWILGWPCTEGSWWPQIICLVISFPAVMTLWLSFSHQLLIYLSWWGSIHGHNPFSSWTSLTDTVCTKRESCRTTMFVSCHPTLAAWGPLQSCILTCPLQVQIVSSSLGESVLAIVGFCFLMHQMCIVPCLSMGIHCLSLSACWEAVQFWSILQ